MKAATEGIAEFFAYPGWNKSVELIGNEIHVVALRVSDGKSTGAHTKKAASPSGVDAVTMLALMLSRLLIDMKMHDASEMAIARGDS